MRMSLWTRSGVASVLLIGAIAHAQTRVTTIKIGQDQIGTIKTAPGISTRLSFRELPTEIICGDLYDPGSGTGSFVVQRSGNDVFLKPVVPNGTSNLFVKTGETTNNIYSFDLVIVSQNEAFRIVNVVASEVSPIIRTPSTNPGSATPVAISLASNTSNLMSGVVSNIPSGSLPVVELPAPPSPNLIQTSRAGDRKVDRRAKVLSERQAITRVLPEYPSEVRRRSVSREVVVRVKIDEAGKVVLAEAVQGDPLLMPAALSAARQWRFAPLTPDSATKRDTGTIRFDFQEPANATKSSR